MGLTGKYDFPGIQKAGMAGLKALLASFTWGAAFLAGPFKFIPDMVFEMLLNWLASEDLIVLNIGAIYIDGHFDQASFDKSIEEGLTRVKKGVTPEQGKAIDDAVIEAFRKFVPYSSKP